MHLYRGDNRISFGRFEFKDHHAIPGIHFETLLMRGQRVPRRGCHIQIGQNFLPVCKNVEYAFAWMERRLHKREDYAMRTGSNRNKISSCRQKVMFFARSGQATTSVLA